MQDIVLKLIDVLPHSLIILFAIMFGIKYLFGENIKDMCNLCKYIKVSIRKDIKREKKDAEQDAKIDNIEKKMETIQDTQIQIIDILTKPKEGK